MIKIFKYELKRLLFNKFFIGLFAVNGIFAWYILTSDTIAGVAFTAPFSPWSFGAYLSSVMPMSMLTVLFMLTFFHSKKEKQVEVLTSATPVDAVRYALVRNAAVALGFLFICLFVIGMSIYFYAANFDFWSYSTFVLPAVVTILPCFVFILGVGHWAGRIHPGFLYALMLVSLAMNLIEFPGAFDFFGGGYYASFPLSLPIGADGEPVYTLSAAFIAARAFYAAVGGVLFVIGVRHTRQKAGRMPQK